MRKALSVLLAVVAVVGLASCSTVSKPFRGSGDKEKARVSDDDKKKRVAFLTFDDALKVDAARASQGVFLPASAVNDAWPNEGGFADHAPQHPAAAAHLKRAWSRGVGEGSGRRARVASPPVVGEGKLFVVDGESEVVAYDAIKGDRIWRSRLKSGEKRDKEFRSGGVAYADGRVYVALGFGAVAALDARTGKEIWRTETSGPMHAPPTAAQGRVFAVSFDNELFAFDAQTGQVLWSYPNLSEPARILTASSPAVAGDVVVTPSASGELTALRVETGRPLWSDSLTRTGGTTALSALNDIAGSPVIVDGKVYAVSQSGLLAAFDIRTGQRLWTQPAGGIHMPWVVGDFLYIMTTDGQLACLSRTDGATIWIKTLPQYKKPKKRKGRIAWAGPVLAGDRLLLASSEGEMLSLSPTTGDTVEKVKLGDQVFIPPIVANSTVYVMTDDAKLIAYR